MWLRFGIDVTIHKSTSYNHFQLPVTPMRSDIEVILGHGIWLNLLYPNGYSFVSNSDRGMQLVPKVR